MNIKQVAAAAKVSPTTVSRVFSGAAPVDSATASRVQRAAKRLGYFPNRYARALGSGRSNTYGLIISDIANPFFPDLVKAFEQKAREFSYETLVVDTDYDTSRMEHCIQRMIEHKVDGVAIMTSEIAPSVLPMLARRSIPVVFLDTGHAGPMISNITIDYESGIRSAVDHLIDRGHQQIAFIQGPKTQQSAILRREAFVSALKAHELRLQPEYLREGDHGLEGGRRSLHELMALKVRPTAVVCSNDLTAIGVLNAAHSLGISIPQELAIVGFDDIQISSLMQPALTTVSVSRAEIASRAFTSLYGRTKGDKARGLVHKIPTRLIVRASS